MYKYFSNVKTLDELKAQYRRLAMKNHPDHGGSEEAMKAINAEYDKLFEQLKHAQNTAADADETGRTHRTTETPEEFRNIIAALLKMHDMTVELCGSWLWIGGNTKEHKEELKALACRWSNGKKLWYWHHPEEGVKWSRGKKSMNEIRTKYGSQTFTGGKESSGYERIGAAD